MKVVILCGGMGTRLKEETEYKPKPLVKIREMPIIWHIMKIYSHFGYKDFILCLGYKGEMIKDYFLHFEEWSYDFTLNLRSKKEKIVHHNKEKLEDWNITFVDTGLDTMTGSRIARIKDYIGKDKEFLLTYGDGLSDVNLRKLYQYHLKKKKIITLIGVYPPTFFGVLEEENGIAKSFKEKPRLKSLINGGFFVCNKKLFNYVTPDGNCIFEEEPLRRLAKERQIAVYRHEGFWYCMDTHKQVAELNKMWTSGKAPWKVWK